MRDTMNILLKPAADRDRDRSPSFLQSGFWGAFKAEFGWRPRHFILEAEGVSTPLLVLERRFARLFSFAYLPHGPALEVEAGDRAALLAAIAEALRPLLSRNALFVRFDPPWYLAEAAAAADPDEAADVVSPNASEGAPGAGPPRGGPERPAVGAPLRRAAADVQPPDTVLLGLEPSEAELLAGMKPKWRYNVRLAEKKGVVVEERRGEAALAALPEFYRLYEATSERDRIALHPEAYYARLFSLAAERAAAGDDPRPDLRLWIARHEGQALAAIVTLFRGGEAVYLYGASSNEKRNLMPAYALQWAAIKAAKAAGCTVYDFYGIPPLDDPEHPMAGLYRFKTGFGGEIAHRAGSWDYALRPAVYGAFRAAEGLRRWWFKDFRKRFGRRGE